ncbi:RICIN domain-containing protein [Streptomyces sp. NPDC057438]|uniref:RICIN domain-containing protein n=1 Tax=Streptomyces sp. NPDC057438 TaxID=3346133 RepID=UPI0036966F69
MVRKNKLVCFYSDENDYVGFDPATGKARRWHVTTKSDGGVTLLNKSGGRAASVWTGNATAGQRIGQWVDDSATGTWNVIQSANGHVKLQSAKNKSLC